jgi:CorA-like Mg2+ transporter protein
VADSPNITSVTSEENITDNFALIHDIATGNGTRFAASSTGLADFAAHNTSLESSLLFLRGFASPQWLTTIGETHRASPELYRRHLEFQAFTSRGRDLYSSPSLPSSSARVFQLTIPTICTRNFGVSGYEPEDLQQARRLESEAMTRYFKQLRTRAKIADSVVRKCLLLSKQEYVLEQTVSIEVGPPGGNWRAIVWLDNGRDLSRSVQGPWNPRPDTRAWETYFFPVIVHQAADLPPRPRKDTALQQNPIVHAVSNHTSRANAKPDEEWRAAQNICLLPFQYGSRLDKDLASRDALYALSELFHFAASAEVQFLNLLHKRIEHELSFVGAENVGQYHSVSLLNLKYIKMLLTSHAQGLTETIGILRNRQSLDWPRVDNAATTEKAAVLLLADFEYLLQRAETLARECEQGMATLANSSVLEESRRSANMAMRVQRLTVIGTIFIPLSFVCSMWGMNFQELGTGSQPMWMLSVSSAPVLLFAYIVYRWDAVKRLYRTITSKRGGE